MNRLRVIAALGPFLIRAAAIGLFGFQVAFVPSGGSFGSRELALVCGLFTAFIAATLNVIFSAMVGLSAFLMQDTSSVYWFWHKLGFAFGGLLSPLDLAPDTIGQMAGAPPLPAPLEAPAHMALGTDFRLIWPSWLVLIGWLLVATLSTHLACRRAIESLKPNGR